MFVITITALRTIEATAHGWLLTKSDPLSLFKLNPLPKAESLSLLALSLQ